MSEAIIVAVITAAATVLCQILVNKKQRASDDIKQAVKDQETKDRLNRIEEKLDIHNGYAERFSEIAVSITEIKKDIEHLKGKS